MSDDDDKVVPFIRPGEIEDGPRFVLEQALEHDLQEVLVVGWSRDGEMFVGGAGDSVASLNLLADMGKQYYLDSLKS